MSDDFILHACEFDGKGGSAPLEGEAIAKRVKDNALAWVHLDATKQETREWLETEIDYLDPLIIDALLAQETRPRIAEYNEGALVILRGVNLNPDSEEEDMVSIRIWVDEHRIISTRLRKLRAVQNIRDRLKKGQGPKNSADFLTTLITNLANNMEPAITELDDESDALEESLIDNISAEKRRAINDIRKKSILLRRYISPQREAIAKLRNTNIHWLHKNHINSLQEQLDKTTRFVEDLDAIRERGQIMKDEIASSLSDQMNKNLYVLSLIAALFLPLGFITGLLGINVGGMPGVDSGLAFWIVCLLCGGLLFIEYLIFRFLRWL
jgi:zinc transporter